MIMLNRAGIAPHPPLATGIMTHETTVAHRKDPEKADASTYPLGVFQSLELQDPKARSSRDLP